MAANSDGYSEVTTVVTCEGDLSDPRFPKQLEQVVGSLNGILGEEVKVRKLEPWNSVRVTLSIPREAALRLRQLANEGPQQLRALGILSVQVEGDQIISLRIATGSVNSESQEIILRTAQDGGSNDRSETDLGLSRFLSASSTSATTSSNAGANVQVQFKSPNVVCPPDSVVPKVGTTTSAPTNVTSAGKAFAGPFPFASMNQAKHSNREAPFNSLPPPYPGKHPPVTISSPLLVNLLQNDGAKEQSNGTKLQQTVASGSARNVRTTSVSVHKPVPTTASVPSSPSAPNLVKPNTSANIISSTQATVLVNNSVSPSALSTNTSIRQNSTILTSTTMTVNNPPNLQYHRPTQQLPVPLQHQQQQQKQVNTITNSVPNSVNGAISTAHSNLPPSNSLPPANLTIPQHPNQIAQVGTLNQTINHMTKANIPQQKGPMTISQSPITNLAMAKVNVPQQQMSLSKPLIPPAPLSKPKVPLPMNQPNKLMSQSSLGYNQSTISNQSGLSNQPSITSSAMGIHQPIGQPGVALPSTTNTINQPSIATNKPQPQNMNNILSRSLPSPPPYSVAMSSRTWDSMVHSTPLLEHIPSLADLKPDDLDELLPPTLERDLADTLFSELPGDLPNLQTTTHPPILKPETTTTPAIEDNRKFLINPLTGELEPQPSDESDTEELKDVFTGLPSPAALSDDDTSSTIRPDTTTDQSDSETRSSDIVKPSRKNSKARERGRDSPANLKPTEKIKLRLKLEKSEPINPAYKVDVSFINTQPKKASSSVIQSEELRVPPLHISLRGRNSVVIKNKNKMNPDGTPMKPKARKTQDHAKAKKADGPSAVVSNDSSNSPTIPNLPSSLDPMKVNNFEAKKFKKVKTNHENKDIIASLSQDNDLKSKLMLHSLYKDKQKERRGSDSELVRLSKKYSDSNGLPLDEKKRRLSQSEQPDEEQPAILGSTNIGTIMGLPQKPRKDKMKLKEPFKLKDVSRNKIFSAKTITDKSQPVKHVVLPTSGEIDMEAKFKQGLLEGTGEKGVPRPPHRTEVVHHIIDNRIENHKVVTVLTESPSTLKEKSPEPDKCNTPERKSSAELENTKTTGNGVPVVGGRSPTSGSAGQGEDSGIESMDALSEKSPNQASQSPNQASQSPHSDVLPPVKAQEPDMLDIEAQLAKMEGLNGDGDHPVEPVIKKQKEDVNENEQHSDPNSKCCELSCVLQDSIKQNPSPPAAPTEEKDTSLVVKTEELDPLPVRVQPALYTYSNPEKGRGGSESPSLTDEDSNSCSTSSTTHGKAKSLLEQLLIEIPNDHQTVPSSPSPVTRSSVRTRALSKLSSPTEVSSPVPKQQPVRPAPAAKRKRNESDSSNHSVEDTRNKKKKVEVAAAEPVKNNKVTASEASKVNNVNKKTKQSQDESSDSDEPLIEKLRKSSTTTASTSTTTTTTVSTTTATTTTPAVVAPTVVSKVNHVTKSKVKGGTENVANNNKTAPTAPVVSTRRSVRSNMPAQNTRSRGDKVQTDAETLKKKEKVQSDSERRKTRSAVSEVDSKRKKEVK